MQQTISVCPVPYVRYPLFSFVGIPSEASPCPYSGPLFACGRPSCGPSCSRRGRPHQPPLSPRHQLLSLKTCVPTAPPCPLTVSTTPVADPMRAACRARDHRVLVEVELARGAKLRTATLKLYCQSQSARPAPHEQRPLRLPRLSGASPAHYLFTDLRACPGAGWAGGL